MNNIMSNSGNLESNTPTFLYLVAFVVLAFAFLVGGCYESSVPLTAPETATLDASLVGNWMEVSQGEDQPLTHMWIQPYDAHSYRVEFCCADFLDRTMETDLLRAHTVLVDSVSFANVQSLEAESPYVFFQYDLSDEGLLTLRPVAECLFVDTTLSTSEALYRFVQAHLGHERLYLDEALYFRKVE
jgi:hypothetical protein